MSLRSSTTLFLERLWSAFLAIFSHVFIPLHCLLFPPSSNNWFPFIRKAFCYCLLKLHSYFFAEHPTHFLLVLLLDLLGCPCINICSSQCFYSDVFSHELINCPTLTRNLIFSVGFIINYSFSPSFSLSP